MNKRLIQYGGYLISGILITWLINPLAAIGFIKFIIYVSILILIPLSGIKLLDKVILLKHQKFWNITVPIWLLMSLYLSFKLLKSLENVINS